MAAANPSILSKRESTLNDDGNNGDSYKDDEFSDEEESYSVHDEA